MCLILTLLAAVAATAVWHWSAAKEASKLGFLSLMYWGAALMWTVDGIFSAAEGEPFFTLTVDDALLGVLVVGCGIAAWRLLVFQAQRTARRSNG